MLILGPEKLRGVGGTLRKIRKDVWRTPQSIKQGVSLIAKLSLQKKGLTSRYLIGLPDLLKRRLGLSPRLLGLLKILGAIDLLGLILQLQGLALAGSISKLLLHFGHPLVILAAGDLLGL